MFTFVFADFINTKIENLTNFIDFVYQILQLNTTSCHISSTVSSQIM